MATPTISKHSPCLNVHNPFARAVLGKKLRSKKVITDNEDLVKTKVVTRSKKLYVVIENLSTRKHELRRSRNSSHSKLSRRKKVKKSTKAEAQEESKTQKRRRNIVISSSISKNKHRKSIKEKKVTNCPTEQRQMSLQESFKRQSLVKCLRPRRNKINYCDDSKLLQQHLPSQHQDSIVILERIDSCDTEKVPVYKTIKTSEQSLENKNDVYDFKYDSNDKKEKLTKKKKKKKNTNIKVKSRTIKKSVHKKVTTEKKPVDNEAGKSCDLMTDPPVEIGQHKSPLEPIASSSSLSETIKKDAVEITGTSIVDTNVQITEQASLPVEQIKKPDAKKLRIISVENATNITITKAPPGSAKVILPFRASSNIFDRRSAQYRNLLNSSLLIKSLSPISKEYDTFDPGSPWRPPQLSYAFSRAKHFVQSTPNEIKMDTAHKKRIMQIKDGSYNADKATNMNDIMTKNINSSLRNLSDNKVGYNRNSNTCRKFGTEITNIEHLNNCTTIQGNNTEVVSEKTLAETETNSVTNVQLGKIASPSSNSPSFDDMHDKENAAANCQTPKKKTKKKLKKRHFSNSSPSKVYEMKSIACNENVDPQPGPSGVKVSNKQNEQRILHQSNLNNFLNLTDMPENTKISTKHGIFSDAHSSPVNSSAIKKSNKPAVGELENAFGFGENDTELDTSSIKSKLATNPATTEVQEAHANKLAIISAPARLSLGELENKLLQKPDKNAGSQQTREQQNVEVSKPPKAKKNNLIVDIVNFSDTFDVLSESGLSNCEVDVPLFADLEPSHFSKPPQYSYKRKRAMALNFSDNSDNEKDEKVRTHAKKKKLTKLEKENKKRLDEWVKTVNSTFQEIDDHDLLIE